MALLGTGCATAYRDSAADEALAEAAPTEAALSHQFTSNRLSKAQLDAFQIRAQQKLRDFIDYLTIIANPALDSAFRHIAAQQAEQLFTSPQAVVPAWSGSPGEPELVSISSFLEALIQQEGVLTFSIEQLAVDQPLVLNDSAQYEGELSFNVSGTADRATHRTGVVVKKVTKKFGQETDSVWEVFLKDIQ